jgi:hypothetical protein
VRPPRGLEIKTLFAGYLGSGRLARRQGIFGHGGLKRPSRVQERRIYSPFPPRRSRQERCRSIPTMRPLPENLSDTQSREHKHARIGKNRTRLHSPQIRTGRGPAKDDSEPNEPGCLSLQTSRRKIPARCSWPPRPPFGKPSFGWGLRSSKEVASHPTRRAFSPKIRPSP